EAIDRCRYDSQSTLLELVSEVQDSPVETAESVWVARIFRAGGEEPAASAGPHLVMRAALGGDGPGATTILRREPAADVLDALLDRSPGRSSGAEPAQTWILRPTPWSPLR
ncbi:MAG: hypothetical protein J2P57_04345, partial [Acidimicrobiaceae bacterium]|nr:hypothetical protein [Acidimicrobiaceae bacterium]